MASRGTSLLVLAAVFAVAFMYSAEAQSSTPSCAQKLTPCAEYMNSTKPPESCCNPIKQTVATERDCLCNLYNTPGLLALFGVNITQALQLTRACGVNPDTSLCNSTLKLQFIFFTPPPPPPPLYFALLRSIDRQIATAGW